MNSQQHTNVKIVTADPSAIGLFGLAIVTFVASSQKLGLTEGLGLVIPWAIFLGAFAQLYASILDAKHNNTFGTTAFGAYAFFWFATASSWLVKLGVFGETLAANADGAQLGFAFVGYLIFSILMTIGSMETHKVLFLIFVLIDVLFVGLTFDAFGVASGVFKPMAAYAEMGIALLSFYGAGAAVLNNHFGRVFLPVGRPFGIFKDRS
ncbi:acetate uptake transporter [Brevibacillus sp. HB1.1]|uniref:acetate uptake transporter n=1 Tax=Brevibacillus sp. HB1.1 TaxID=2738808 RepID=UPI001575BA07|nr:acetate uptake transporter [Brevibacillus sp. HB1.1]NTU30675.1 acetate uptake transporter [Brevibacillus sp. HB1.1]